MSELFPRPLKNAGSRAIEDALQKAMCDLTGEPYKASIHSVDFGDDVTSAMSDVVRITFTVSKERDWFKDEPVTDSLPDDVTRQPQ